MSYFLTFLGAGGAPRARLEPMTAPGLACAAGAGDEDGNLVDVMTEPAVAPGAG